MAVTRAELVSDYFIYLVNDYGDLLTNLKLQKLLYYAQGWHLGIYGEPLFDENIEAWVHGPVVHSEYKRFDKYRWNPINTEIEKPDLTPETQEFLFGIYDLHSPFSAWELERATHDEPPWKEARGNLPADAYSANVISHESMKDYFESRLDDEKT